MESRSAPFAHGPTARESELSGVYGEGIVAGLLGAATIAVWFLIVDTINGQPLHTPTVLGTTLFRGGAGLDHPETLPVSYEMVMAFTWVHGLILRRHRRSAARLPGARRAPG
jgi:hypothetical protein